MTGFVAWAWSGPVEPMTAAMWFAVGAFTVVAGLFSYALGEMLVDRWRVPPRTRTRKRKGGE